jgi:glycosyltransferase involved in cell wall biosynthesis
VHEHAILLNQPFYQTIADTLLSPFTDKAVAVSNDVAEFMKEYRKTRNRDLEVIYNGINIESFVMPEAEKIEQERRKLNIPPQAKVICIIGRLDPIKGHKYLFNAFLEIKKDYPESHLLVVGEGPERQNLEQLSSSLGIRDKVIFTGYHNKVEICLGLASVFVMSSISEGLPISLLEAMNLGLPIVAFPAGGIKDIIVHGKNGLLAPMRNSNVLAEQIKVVFQNKEFSEQLGSTAKSDCKKYDIKKSVKRLEQIYQLIAKNK